MNVTSDCCVSWIHQAARRVLEYSSELARRYSSLGGFLKSTNSSRFTWCSRTRQSSVGADSPSRIFTRRIWNNVRNSVLRTRASSFFMRFSLAYRHQGVDLTTEWSTRILREAAVRFEKKRKRRSYMRCRCGGWGLQSADVRAGYELFTQLQQ